MQITRTLLMCHAYMLDAHRNISRLTKYILHWNKPSVRKSKRLNWYTCLVLNQTNTHTHRAYTKYSYENLARNEESTIAAVLHEYKSCLFTNIVSIVIHHELKKCYVFQQNYIFIMLFFRTFFIKECWLSCALWSETLKNS